VPTPVVSQLMLRCDRDGNLLPPRILQKGDAVTLTKGSFAGFTATIEGMAPERRIWLLLELMGHNMRVSARSSDLRAA
jgi:transcriptional antiterminator RfaH